MAGKRRRNTVAFRNTAGAPRKRGRTRIPPPDWLGQTTLGGPYGGPTSALPHGKWVSPSVPAVSTPPTAGPQRSAPPFPGFLTADQMLARARAQVMGAVGPQQDYYNKLIQQNQAQAEARAKFVAGLYQALGQFQRGVAPAVQGAYAQAGRDQAAIAQGYAGNMRDVAAQDAAAINADLAKAGTPQAGMVPGDHGAANVLYALGGAIPGRTLGAQGAAFGSAAAFLPSSTAGYGVRQAEYGLSQADQRRQEIQAELDKLVASEPSLIQEQLAGLQKNQSDAQRWWTQFNYNKDQDKAAADYQKAQDAAAADAKAQALKQARIDAGLAEARDAHIVDSAASGRWGYIVYKDGTFAKDKNGNYIPIYEKPQREPGKPAPKPPKYNADLSKRYNTPVGIDPQTGQIVAMPGAKPFPKKPPYVPPTKSKQNMIRERNHAVASQTKWAGGKATSLAKSGMTRSQARKAIYDVIYPALRGYTTSRSRAQWEKQIAKIVNVALFNAGWRTGKDTTSTLYKPKGSGSGEGSKPPVFPKRTKTR